MSPIITAARAYIGTRFQHQGRLGKTGAHRGGMDCLGLLVNVARDCGLRSRTGQLLAEVDEFNYPHYPDTARLREMLSTHLCEVAVSCLQEADIALFEIDGRAQHMGIICHPAGRIASAQDLVPLAEDSALAQYAPQNDEFTLIHAYAPARAVVEHALDEYWQQKIVGVFRGG